MNAHLPINLQHCTGTYGSSPAGFTPYNNSLQHHNAKYISHKNFDYQATSTDALQQCATIKFEAVTTKTHDTVAHAEHCDSISDTLQNSDSPVHNILTSFPYSAIDSTASSRPSSFWKFGSCKESPLTFAPAITHDLQIDQCFPSSAFSRKSSNNLQAFVTANECAILSEVRSNFPLGTFTSQLFGHELNTELSEAYSTSSYNSASTFNDNFNPLLDESLPISPSADKLNLSDIEPNRKATSSAFSNYDQHSLLNQKCLSISEIRMNLKKSSNSTNSFNLQKNPDNKQLHGVNIDQTSYEERKEILHNQNSMNKCKKVNIGGKPKRKRVATFAQRRAANIRERKRMFNLNEAFDNLRSKVPTFAYEKRLSRIETLRLAIIYINFMANILKGKTLHEIQTSPSTFKRAYVPSIISHSVMNNSDIELHSHKK